MRREATFPTPHGDGRVFVEDGLLVEVRLPRLGEAPAVEADLPTAAPLSTAARLDAGADSSPDASMEIAARWAGEFAAFFRGEQRIWSAEEIGLERYSFTPFQEAVYRALLTVPAGAVVTYGELARLAGYPRAARAVGTVMATNPIAIVVPCHRVVRSDGSLGRYGFGDGWKPLLLALEGSRT